MKQELPINRVKRVIKRDPDIHAAQKQAVVAVEAATQLFVSYFAEQAHQRAGGKRMQYRHFAEAAHQLDELSFIRPLVPQQQSLEMVLKKRADANMEGEGQPLEPQPEVDEPEGEVEVDGDSSSDDLPEE